MTSSGPVGVIAGTGVIGLFDLEKAKTVRTAYGSSIVLWSPDRRFVVVPRHGPGHSVPPHMVNYRANVAALEKLGVVNVIATSAVGSMNKEFRVGELGLVGQFLDFTKARKETFFDKKVHHTDMTEPYSR